MNPIDLTYALAKYVPDMERGFTIATSYGDLRIESEDAAPFAALAKALLEWQYRATGAEELEGVGDLEEEDESASQVLTAEQIKADFRARGETLASFARSNGFEPKDVYRVMGGVFKGKYGRCHQIAVKLGLKAGEVKP